MSVPGPIHVAVIDVGQPIVDVDCTRVCEPPYAAAWILACRDGRPLGSVELPVHQRRIPGEQLERELRAKLGGAWDRRAAQDAPQLARATVVVPTALSRPEQLRSCVRSLTELDHPDYEVIVVDNRPAGAPPVDLPGVRVVRETRPGISAARNRGLQEARGEIVAFTDDDVEVDRRWLRAIGERFARAPELAAVTGLVVPAELETPAQIFFEQSGSGLDRGYAPLTFERAGRFQITRRDEDDGTERIQSLYEMGELGLGSNMAFRIACSVLPEDLTRRSAPAPRPRAARTWRSWSSCWPTGIGSRMSPPRLCTTRIARRLPTSSVRSTAMASASPRC